MQQYIVGRQFSQQFVGIAAFIEALAVEVGVLVGKFSQQSGVGNLDVVRCYTGSVGRNKDVGNNASAAIYGAACCGFEYEGAVDFYTVGGENFATVVAVENLGFVFAVVSGFVVFLYTASRRGVVALYRETELA